MESEVGSKKEIDNSVYADRTLLHFLLHEKESIEDGNELFCQQYVEQLSSFSLSKLNAEPNHLREKHNDLIQQTQSLAYDNYQTFIQAADCSKEVYKDFNIIEEHLDSLLNNIPSFAKGTESFSRVSQEINSCRKQNSLVLSRHTQLLEVLEIPQLMETCVRNGYYEEALELSNFVKRLGKKFSTIKIIGDIHTEVIRSTQYMLSQLLVQLTGNIQLPACLRIISYVRQLDVFKEVELRIKFLEARESWFKEILSQISEGDTYQHLSKVIEVSRVNLFDIITQYKAIFSDDDPSYNFSSNKPVNYAHILQSWVSRKISDFMITLQEDLHKGIGGRLDSIYGQCMYFGLSFSRVGADFRGIIIPIFHRYAWKQFSNNVLKATKSRSRHEKISGLHLLYLWIICYDEQSSFKGQLSQKRNLTFDQHSPPHQLLEFPPVAIYLNTILTAFNNLRQYAAVSLVYQIKTLLMTSLEKVFTALQNWAKLKQQSYPNSNSDDVKFYCTLVCACLLPFLKSILVNFFGTNSLNEMNGRLPSTLTSTQVKAIYILETEQYINLLKEFIDRDDLYESVKVEAGKESPQKDIIENDIEPDKDTQPPSESISVDESALATGDMSADIQEE